MTVVNALKPSVWLFLSPLAVLRAVAAPRYLIVQLAWREVRAKYHGTYLGILWSYGSRGNVFTVAARRA
jgi:ABC-type polysaccharide/polyol phosphate export permease